MDHTIPCIGYRIEAEDFTLAYTGDTQPCPGAAQLAEDCTLIVHGATYLNKDADKARRTKHSTVLEAGTTAKDSKAKDLILTHVNDDYETEEQMLREVKTIYRSSGVAHDGLEIALN